MKESLIVFVNGVAGVFLGMAVLYGAIRFISFVAGRFAKGEGAP